MTQESDRELVALIAQEQRGFRFILMSGLFVLILLVVMSAGLGVYYYNVSQQLSTMYNKQAFDTRRDRDAQNNRVAAQDMRLRRIHDEIRRAAGSPSVTFSAQQMDSALASALTYLERGRVPFAEEQLIDAASQSGSAAETPAQSLLTGVSLLLQFERSGDTVANAPALPQTLTSAKTAFERALADPSLQQVAQLGLASVAFQEATRINFKTDACEAVFDAVAASAGNGTPGAQPLYWQAQCERKLGRTVPSLKHYAQSLNLTAEVSRDPRADYADLALAMNAFHGVGTTLIASFEAPEADITEALAVAQRECRTPTESGSPRMRIAEACLREAMALRQRLGQTPNQVSGSSENLSFVYLRDNDFQRAFAHAQSVEDTGLFAWTELVRALSAAHVEDEGATETQEEARRHITYFTVPQFNLCEVRMLLSDELYEEAVQIIQRQHRGTPVSCEAPA